MKHKQILKSSGEIEEFSPSKLVTSLQKAGVPKEQSLQLEAEIEKNNLFSKSTDSVHKYLLHKLKETNPVHAARYNLRRAIIQLGPSGYPFEQFVAKLLESQGYACATNLILRGKCITHEVDVVAQDQKGQKKMVEVKFHNKTGIKSNVKVPLYVHSRFNDISANPKNKGFDQAWIVTNTKFSEDALTYSLCNNIHALSWNTPLENNIAQIIEENKVYPITVLTELNVAQQQQILDTGIILCTELLSRIDILIKIGLSDEEISQLIAEIKQL